VRPGALGRTTVAGEKILICDDNVQIRMLIKAALMSGGYQLIEAQDGEQGLQAAITEKPDLMLLDVTMPKLDGFEVLQFMRKRPETEYTKVMMLTTAGLASDVSYGYTLGVIGYMVKPFEPGQLRDAVAKALSTPV
jgi:two-component system chemotaxis response regulator CheY